MRRLLALCLLVSVPAWAGFSPIAPSTQQHLRHNRPSSSTGPDGYVGPGDLAAFTAWYSCTRGYSAAVAATGTQAACDLRRVSDNDTCTALIGTDGNVDLTVGTPCTGGTETVTTWVGASSARISKVYDQTNNNACSAASCDLVQAIAADQHELVLTGGGGNGIRPYISKNAGYDGITQGVNNFTPNAALQMSLSIVWSQTTTDIVRFLISNNGLGTDGIRAISSTGANTMALNGLSAPAADGVWHAGNGRAIHNVSNETIFNVDGAEVIGITSMGAAVGPPGILDPVGLDNAVKQFGEGGFQDNALWSAGLRTALCHNQRLYWGTPGTC